MIFDSIIAAKEFEVIDDFLFSFRNPTLKSAFGINPAGSKHFYAEIDLEDSTLTIWNSPEDKEGSYSLKISAAN